MTGAAATTKAGRREWAGLAVIALPCLLYAMDLTVLNLAVPQLSGELAPSGTQLLWIVDIYGFLVAGLLVIMGTVVTGSAAAGCCCWARPRSPAPRWPRPSRPARAC